MLNYATTKDINGNDVLKYLVACFSLLCEYLVNTNTRVQNAAFQSLRMMLSHGLKKEYFVPKTNTATTGVTDLLNLD